MNLGLTASQQAIVDLAEQVSIDCLAGKADHYDQAGTHPYESWNAVWRAGLLAMTVPRAYGGLDLDMPTYCQAIEKLATGCTSTAMTVHMHSTVMRFIARLGTPAQKAMYYPEVVEEGKIFGSWGSEPETRGGAIIYSRTTIAPTEGNYVINGLKHFCTMAGGAHRSLVHCLMEGVNSPNRLIQALVPEGTPGMRVVSEWNTLGMRATVSPSVSFENCVVPAEAVLGMPGQSSREGVGMAFAMGYSAVYLGAAQAALDFTVEYCRTHQFDPDPATLAENLLIQRSVAEMTMALEGARLVLYQSADRWADADPIDRVVLGSRAKYLATQAALQVTSLALQCVGGRSVYKTYPLERLFRDIRTCTLMPPNLERTLEVIGKDRLGLQDQLISNV